MSFPSIGEYNQTIISKNGRCLRELSEAVFVPVRTSPIKVYAFGSGANAVVFKANYHNRTYGFRCFLNNDSDRVTRAKSISKYLENVNASWKIDYRFLENEIIGKPIDRADAIAILQKLSGKTHRVITGVYLVNDTESSYFSETTLVHFHPLTLSQIEYYVDQYQPYDKAGAYGIQDWIGVVGIRGIEGDFYNVMGLPVSKLLGYLPTTNSMTTTK